VRRFIRLIVPEKKSFKEAAWQVVLYDLELVKFVLHKINIMPLNEWFIPW
jgi:hypothetical protein